MILHASSSQIEKIENWTKYTRIEIVLPDFYIIEIQFLFFFSIWERHFCRIFWFGRGKKVKTRRRDAGPWKLLADVKIVFNFQLLLTARTGFHFVHYRLCVLKPVSFEMISRYPDDIYSPVIIVIYSNARSALFPAAAALCHFCVSESRTN